MKTLNMDYQSFRMFQESYDGYCTDCNDITNCGVEPDAEGYQCDCCGEDTVMGMENALIMGHITISD